MSNLTENLESAHHCTIFAVQDLKNANTRASPVEHIIIMQLLADAVSLADRIGELNNASRNARYEK